MILECASCAKMYRIRDDASPQPSKCPTCSGELRPAGSGAHAAGNPTRVREPETKVEALQKKLDAVEIQRLNDLNAFDTRVREKEQSDRDELDRATQQQQQGLAALREEMEAKIEEKDRLISDGRQSLDREAGERRR